MQRKTTASNSLPDDWEALGRLMALRLAYYVKVYGIPKELVVGLDETPVKTTPNAELATRALRNSGDVAGVGKENKYQVTATPLISAAGLLGAPSLAELEADPELKKKPALRTQIIFDGVSLVKKGPRMGQPLLTACPTDMLDKYPQFTFAQTPTHFARHESFTLLIEQNLVPYFEAKIEEMGLVGAKKIAELKALGEETPEHQHCVLKLDVYSVHREAKFRSWLKDKYPWILLNFVPASCTKKFQELDVGINSQIQLGSKTACNALQVARIEEQLEKDPEATPIIDISKSQLKRDVLPLLAAGMTKARDLGETKMRAVCRVEIEHVVLMVWSALPLIFTGALGRDGRGAGLGRRVPERGPFAPRAGRALRRVPQGGHALRTGIRAGRARGERGSGRRAYWCAAGAGLQAEVAAGFVCC